MKHYDIFISYRRSSYDTANLIATRLKSAGYSVFFDMETLRSGKFNEQLYKVIDSCKDFVLVLPPDALDRCTNEDDWIRLEVCRAISGKKNIIPVMLNGFTWPKPMPNGMEELSQYQALTASSVEYFDMAMERLQQIFLHSKTYLPVQRMAKKAIVSIMALLILLMIICCALYFLSYDTCKMYATKITAGASSIHIIAEQNDRMSREWNMFCNKINSVNNDEEFKLFQNEMLERIDMVETNIKNGWLSDSVEMNITNYQRFMLSLHGINSEEMKYFPSYYTLQYNDYLDNLNLLRNIVNDPIEVNLRYAAAILEMSRYSNNAFYAAVLSGLSEFPENSLRMFEESYPQWIYFPLEYGIGEDEDYYVNIINAENKKAEDVLHSVPRP